MTTLEVTDNGDGTWTATGPDDVVTLISETEFKITAPSVVIPDTFTVSNF
jgi:hypothetical protein